MAAVLTILTIFSYAGLIYSIPPPQCTATFKWDDCGKTPTPVIYYWKPGSRCEVGIWRGCLPNMNMFRDEYECVTTCIFTVRAADQNFHQINGGDEDETNIADDYGLGSTVDGEDGNATTVADSEAPGEDGESTTAAGDGSDNADSTGGPESETEKSADAETTIDEGQTPEGQGGDTTAEGGPTEPEGETEGETGI